METTWSPCLHRLHNTAGVILLKWKFFCHFFAKTPQWSWIIFKTIDPDDLASPYLSGLNLSVILCSSYGRLSSKSTLLPLPQSLCICYSPCWECLSLSFNLSKLLLNLQDSPLSAASLDILSTTDQIAPEDLTIPLSIQNGSFLLTHLSSPTDGALFTWSNPCLTHLNPASHQWILTYGWILHSER